MSQSTPSTPRFSLKGFGRLFRIQKNELRKTKSSNTLKSLISPKQNTLFQSVNEETVLRPLRRRSMGPSQYHHHFDTQPNRERVVDPKRRTLRAERGKSKVYQSHEISLLFQQFEKQLEKVPIPTEVIQSQILDDATKKSLSTTPPNVLRVLSTTPPNDVRALSTTPPSDSLTTDVHTFSDEQILENKKTKLAKLVSLTTPQKKQTVHSENSSTVEEKKPVQQQLSLSPNQQLFVAAFAGDVDTVKSLLQGGEVNVNHKNIDHQSATALHGATANNRLEVMELLILAGADVNIIDAGYRTALHIAIAHNFVEAALLLLGKGAKTMIRDHYGYRYKFSLQITFS
jgi:hypothetical protein